MENCRPSPTRNHTATNIPKPSFTLGAKGNLSQIKPKNVVTPTPPRAPTTGNGRDFAPSSRLPTRIGAFRPRTRVWSIVKSGLFGFIRVNPGIAFVQKRGSGQKTPTPPPRRTASIRVKRSGAPTEIAPGSEVAEGTRGGRRMGEPEVAEGRFSSARAVANCPSRSAASRTARTPAHTGNPT